MPRFRFTIRWLMILVVIIASALGMETMRRRRSGFSTLAVGYASLQEIARERADSFATATAQFKEYGFDQRDGSLSLLEAMYRERAKHFGLLSDKYRDAARHPWLPLASDPPAPPEPIFDEDVREPDLTMPAQPEKELPPPRRLRRNLPLLSCLRKHPTQAPSTSRPGRKANPTQRKHGRLFRNNRPM